MPDTHHLPTLAVTGATGALGGLVARELAGRGVAQRLLARRPDAVPSLPGAVALSFALDDREASLAALDGVDTVLMVSGAEDDRRAEQHRVFVEAAADAGVRHIVYTSFAGASATCTFLHGRDHFDTEQAIREAAERTGWSWTFLRDNFYLEMFPFYAGEDGVIRGPAGQGRCAGVSREDVARVAVETLLDPDAHANQTYTLSGPEAFTMDEAAVVLSNVLGRPVRFEDESMEQARASRAAYGAPDWLVDTWISTYTAMANGELDEVTDDVRRVSGREPLSLEQVLRALA